MLVNILPQDALRHLGDDPVARVASRGAPTNNQLRIVECYRLELADTLSMDLFTTAASDAWVRKVARIMHLERRPPRETARLQCNVPGADQLGRQHGVLTIQSNGNQTHVVSDVRPSVHGILTLREVWQSFYPFYRHLLGMGGFPLHAALIKRGARWMLLAGKPGAGKSTCCRRLPAEWDAVCDEEVVVVPFNDGTWHAYPFPTWSDIVERKLDRTWNTQHHYPLSAIFLLERGEEDRAEPVGEGETALSLNRRTREKCFFYDWGLDKKEEQTLRMLLFENVCALARSIPGYRLAVTRTGKFWEEMERVLNV